MNADTENNQKISELKVEIFNLEKHLGQILSSKLRNSQSYRYTASNLKELIEQKTMEIIELQKFMVRK